MKVVLIPMAVLDDGLNEHVAVRSRYVEKLVNQGLLPVMISPRTPFELLEELYAQSDGILLLGGADIGPVFYGMAKHHETKPGNEVRDKFEIELVRRAVRDRKPVLGICRGCQMLAVALGGRLNQHVPDRYCGIDHVPPGSTCYAESVTGKTHEVAIEPGSLVSEILSGDVMSINSAHHQSVDEPGPVLRIVGRSNDGCAEFIEHSEKGYFCVGVQGHPEAMDDPRIDRLFAAFARRL